MDAKYLLNSLAITLRFDIRSLSIIKFGLISRLFLPLSSLIISQVFLLSPAHSVIFSPWYLRFAELIRWFSNLLCAVNSVCRAISEVQLLHCEQRPRLLFNTGAFGLRHFAFFDLSHSLYSSCFLSMDVIRPCVIQGLFLAVRFEDLGWSSLHALSNCSLKIEKKSLKSFGGSLFNLSSSSCVNLWTFLLL